MPNDFKKHDFVFILHLGILNDVRTNSLGLRSSYFSRLKYAKFWGVFSFSRVQSASKKILYQKLFFKHITQFTKLTIDKNDKSARAGVVVVIVT